MLEIETYEVEPGMVRFQARGEDFVAEFVSPSPDGPGLVKHENEWRLALPTYHTHREGRPLKRSRSQQRARLKLLGFFPTVEECQKEVLRYLAIEEVQR